jgi:hypothetical protein
VKVTGAGPIAEKDIGMTETIAPSWAATLAEDEKLGGQRSAPYLDAVVGYAFRGPARFHVPGHKGGPGADPALRKAIGVDALAADVPQDIQGIDAGPSPTPYERAERLAASACGAKQSFFLTNGATQGNHALCLAMAGPMRCSPAPTRSPGRSHRVRCCTSPTAVGWTLAPSRGC